MPITFDAAFESTRQTFGEGRREAEVCTYIFELIKSLKGGFECISLGEVVSHFKWYNDIDAAKSIQTVLDCLAYGDVPVLERRFILWPEIDEDLLEVEEAIFSDAEIRDALRDKKLINPNTGEVVENFLDKIHVVYCATDYIKKISKNSEGDIL